MLRTRTRKISHDILARKGRSILVCLSIMIGVFAVTTMTSLTDLINRQLAKDIHAEAISDTHVYLLSTSDTPISAAENETYLSQLRQLEGVETVEGQAVYPVTWGKGDTATEKGFIVAFSAGFGDAHLEPISRTIAGRYPHKGQHEIAIEQRFADQYGVKVGDKLTFSNQAEAWTVVGTVIHPYFTIAPAIQDQIQPTEAIYATYTDAQTIAGFMGLSAIHVRYQKHQQAEDGLNPLIESIAQHSPYVVMFTFLDNPDDNFIMGIIEQVNSALTMLGVLAMVISGFLVTNVMNSVILEQRKQIGVMKAIGANLTDNFLIYAGMALVYGAIGSLLGIALALPVAAFAAQMVAPMSFTYIDGFQVSLLGVVTGLGMGLAVPVIAAFLPVLNGMRVSILQAMTDLGLASTWGKSRVSRWIGGLPLPRVMVQALSNIYQKKARLLLTGITLTFATSAFMAVTAVTTNLGDFVDELFTSIDYQIVVNLQNKYDPQPLAAMIEGQVAEVESVNPGYSVTVGIEGFSSTNPLTEGSNQVNAVGIDASTATIDFQLREGKSWSQNEQGVVISRSLATALAKGAGDDLTFTLNGQSYTYPILGVDSYAYDVLYMDWRDLATKAGYVDASGNPLPSTLYIHLRESATTAEVEDTLDKIAAVLSANGVQASYTNQLKVQDNQVQPIQMFGMIFNMTSAIMAFVGAIGLLATLSMAVYERQKEIGVLRSVGAGSGVIIGQFITEGIMIGVLAWIVAIPLSIVLGIGLIAILPFDYLTFGYSPAVLLWGLLGIIVVSGAASLFPAWTASRKTVAEILRYQ